MLRITILAAIVSSLAFAGPGPEPVIGTISSSMPILINGSEMLPAVAPSWPLVTKDEVVTEAPALLRTANRDEIIFDGKTRARIASGGGSFNYIYVRQGGLQFDAKQGPVFICIGGRLYIPNKSAKGALRLNQASTVASSLEKGTFAEAGTRSCDPEFSASFLNALTKPPGGVAGGGIGGGVSAKTVVGITTALGAAGAAGAGALGLFNSGAANVCNSSSGCNFNPPSISPSSP